VLNFDFCIDSCIDNLLVIVVFIYLFLCQLVFLSIKEYHYPAIHSIGLDTKFIGFFIHFFMYSYRFLSRGFTDYREILLGSLATFQRGFLLFLGDSPRDG